LQTVTPFQHFYYRQADFLLRFIHGFLTEEKNETDRLFHD